MSERRSNSADARSWSAFYLNAIAGRSGLRAAVLRGVLAGLEPLYAYAARRRTRRYDEGRAHITRADVPVLSVGNLTVGGTGKSPCVEWLARRAQNTGWRVGILCRGYGRARDQEFNEEAQWLRESLPQVEVVCDADRVRGARTLVQRGCDLVLLDDGFQHRRLARDFDLVLLDAAQPFGHEHLLPRGLLREDPRGLARAHALVLTRTDQVTPAQLHSIQTRLDLYAPGVPRFRARHAPAAWLQEQGESPLEHLPRGPVGLISALARPAAFEQTVRDLGFEVRVHRKFGDHHRYQASDLDAWDEVPRWLTTTKDWVKLRAFGLPRMHALRIEMAFDGADPWDLMACALQQRTSRREIP